ncbi:MAG: iron-only hydrogenase system regulator [Clostridia bacterium]|nr:iron-only hydrogenase system regulator [Clostridia bacterium]MBR2601625.1 iron-only hydrogenase system regulator [Clostridia bacterium]MBR7173433.1 iron-only hydrogenase system regulator [Clostridia bacterium]
MTVSETNDSRLAVVAIVVEEPDSVSALNELLHQHSAHIIGRMGIPCPARGVSLISIAMDAPGDAISALTGKLGRLKGVSVKTAYSKA